MLKIILVELVGKVWAQQLRTVMAVVVALFGERMKARFFPPKTIAYLKKSDRGKDTADTLLGS